MPTVYTGNPANNPTSITIPSDGQGPIKAADVNPAFEGLLDKAAAQAVAIAALQARAMVSITAYRNGSALTLESFGDVTYANGTTIIVNVTNPTEVGDIISVDFTGKVAVSTISNGWLDIIGIQDVGGLEAEITSVGTEREIDLSAGGQTGTNRQISMIALFVVTIPGQFRVLLRGRVNNGADTLNVNGHAIMRVSHHRS